MIEYSLDYQYSMAITWFFLGEDNSIAEFNSGGAILPNIIAKNASLNEILIDYFDNLPEFTEAQKSPLIDKYINPDRILEPDKYGYYAKRGLVSFDKINFGPGDNSIDYHLIAHPVEYLKWNDLPQQIQEILLLFKQPIPFKSFYKLDEGLIPWTSLFTDFSVPLSYDPIADKKRKQWWYRLFSNY